MDSKATVLLILMLMAAISLTIGFAAQRESAHANFQIPVSENSSYSDSETPMDLISAVFISVGYCLCFMCVIVIVGG